MKTILIIEDDPAVAEGLKESLRNEHFNVIAANNGEEGSILAKKEEVDLILLDLILPDMDGMDICRDLRSSGIYIPVIMLTGKKDEIDKIIGLEIGANDYITKPFNVRELIIRVKNILNLVDHIKTHDIKNYRINNIEVDFGRMEIAKGTVSLTLSVMEVKILKYLIEKEGKVVTRDELLDNVWGYDVYPVTRTVDNYILSLRKKIEDDPGEPKHILTVYKAGYKFVK